jgi:hypothetical protein
LTRWNMFIQEGNEPIRSGIGALLTGSGFSVADRIIRINSSAGRVLRTVGDANELLVSWLVDFDARIVVVALVTSARHRPRIIGLQSNQSNKYMCLTERQKYQIRKRKPFLWKILYVRRKRMNWMRADE